LLLGLNACGGDGGDKGIIETVQPAAMEQLMAITFPHWTTFPLDISRNPDGSEILNIPDPTLGMQRVAIRSRDAEGNITALDDQGPFRSVISFLNNRIGMICGSDIHFKKGLPGWDLNSGHYLYLSTDFQEVDHRESLGRKYRTYKDCKVDGLFSIDTAGRSWDMEDLSSPASDDITPIFASDGRKVDTGSSTATDRAKAYRLTVNGKDIYAIVGVVAVDPAAPQAEAREQSVYFAISE